MKQKTTSHQYLHSKIARSGTLIMLNINGELLSPL